MRKLNYFDLFLSILFLLLIPSCGSTQSAAEKQELAQEVRTKIEDADFTFKATYAFPTGYKSIFLSPYYDVKVSPDTVVAYLPYYGRAYSAPMDPSEGGIKFTSTDFSYKVRQGKKSGNWMVDIQFNDVKRDVSFSFDIWENGSARLNVSDVNRQSISFNGDIVVEEKDE